MKPFFDIAINGVYGLAENAVGKCISLQVTDSAGFENPKVVLAFNDDPPNEIPDKNTPIGIVIGYHEMKGAASKYNGVKQSYGTFYLDEVRLSKPPNIMELTAHTCYMGNRFKKIKDRDFHNKTLMQIVGQIAEDNEITAVISDEIDDTVVKHADQSNVSDMEFLTRLAQDHDAVFKIIESILYFGRKGAIKAISGQPTPVIELYDEDVTMYSVLSQERSVYTGVRARYINRSTGEEEVALAGEEGNTRTLPHRYVDKEEAQDAADARFNDLDKEAETLTFSCVGNPNIVAESPILLKDFRDGISKIWQVDRVTHSISASGFTTRAECKLPTREVRLAYPFIDLAI